MSISLRALYAIGIPITGFLCGQTSAASYMAIPTIIHAPDHLLPQQWRTTYLAGKYVAVPAIYGLTSLYALLAYASRGTFPSSSKLYAISSVLLISVLPYTAKVLGPVNGKLMGMAARLDNGAQPQDVKELSQARELVNKWGRLNVLRAVSFATAAICATWASLKIEDGI